MTVRSNQPRLCASAKRLTSVGLAAGSIGPPISTIERGWQGSFAAASNVTAAKTGTEGWHTAMPCIPGPRRRIADYRHGRAEQVAGGSGEDAKRGERAATCRIRCLEHGAPPGCCRRVGYVHTEVGPNSVRNNVTESIA